MRTRGTGLLSVLLCVLAFGAATASDFSADVYSGVPGSKALSKTGRVHISGKMIRIDASAEGRTMSTITRLDKRVFWVLDPARKQYMEIPITRPELADPASDAALLERCTKKNLGKETVSGFECEKAQYTDKSGRGVKIIRWLSRKLNWPIKSQINTPDGKAMVEETRNINIGKQPASLFALPKGYKKQELPKHGAPAPVGKKPR